MCSWALRHKHSRAKTATEEMGEAEETVPLGVYLRALASDTPRPKPSKIGSEFHRLLAGVVLLLGRVPSPSNEEI